MVVASSDAAKSIPFQASEELACSISKSNSTLPLAHVPAFVGQIPKSSSAMLSRFDRS